MRRRSIGDTSPAPIAVLRHWTAMACLVACALQRVALTREVAADSTTAQADYEYFRGDFFPELMNPSPGIESDDNDRRHHEYRCTDCADDQEPDAYERRAHEHRCAECAEEPGQDGQERRAHEHHRCADCDPTEPRSLQSTAAYEIDGGGDGHRNRHDDTPRNSPRPPPTVFVNKKRDHRYRVVVPPIYRRRHGVINSSTFLIHITYSLLEFRIFRQMSLCFFFLC